VITEEGYKEICRHQSKHSEGKKNERGMGKIPAKAFPSMKREGGFGRGGVGREKNDRKEKTTRGGRKGAVKALQED